MTVFSRMGHFSLGMRRLRRRYMLVTVPDGAGPGSQLVVTTPTGDQQLVQCPDGVVAGQQMQIDLPDPAAAPPIVVMADAVPVAAPSPAPAFVAAPADLSASAPPLLGTEKVDQAACPSPAPEPVSSPPPYSSVPVQASPTSSVGQTDCLNPAPEPSPSPSLVVGPNELLSWLQGIRLEKYAASCLPLLF